MSGYSLTVQCALRPTAGSAGCVRRPMLRGPSQRTSTAERRLAGLDTAAARTSRQFDTLAARAAALSARLDAVGDPSAAAGRR
ncbi:hypothetical protein [Streptomyces sp. NPDC001820]|uniref:hypothetical protein n=1 Tax=Streptomyces sp. NPDC001820 TaxID=3364613 RepID=UPI0036AF8D27